MDIKIYRYLYVSESLEPKKSRILGRLVSNELQPGVYVIVLSKNEQEQLEFFDTVLLKQRLFSSESLFVVGLARGYDDAMYLIEEIMADVYRKTGMADVKSYVIQRQEQYELMQKEGV